MSELHLYEKLKALNSAQLDDLTHILNLDAEYLPGRDVPPATRAGEIYKLILAGGSELVALAVSTVVQILPSLPRQPAPLETVPHYQYRPKVQYKTRYTASIDDWYDDFASIWDRDRNDRKLGVFDLGMHIFDHASRVCHAIRLERPQGVIDDLADTSVWLMSFIAQCQRSDRPVDRPFRFKTSLSNLIWNRYPAMCPVCFTFGMLEIIGLSNGNDLLARVEAKYQDLEAEVKKKAERFKGPERCSCLSRTALYRAIESQLLAVKPIFNDLRVQYADLLRNKAAQVVSIPALNDMFSKIFTNSYYVLSLDTIAFHLLEKVGTMTRAFKDMYTYDEGRELYSDAEYGRRLTRFEEEIADVFSWMFATELKITSVYHRDAGEYLESVLGSKVLMKIPSLNFADVIWSKYGRAQGGGTWDQLRCPGCDSAPCSCNRDLRIDIVDHSAV